MDLNFGDSQDENQHMQDIVSGGKCLGQRWGE